MRRGPINGSDMPSAIGLVTDYILAHCHGFCLKFCKKKKLLLNGFLPLHPKYSVRLKMQSLPNSQGGVVLDLGCGSASSRLLFLFCFFLFQLCLLWVEENSKSKLCKYLFDIKVELEKPKYCHCIIAASRWQMLFQTPLCMRLIVTRFYICNHLHKESA